MKLTQNSFKTILKLFCFIQNQPLNQPWKVLALLAKHKRYPLFRQTVVYRAINQTFVNKHGG